MSARLQWADCRHRNQKPARLCQSLSGRSAPHTSGVAAPFPAGRRCADTVRAHNNAGAGGGLVHCHARPHCRQIASAAGRSTKISRGTSMLITASTAYWFVQSQGLLNSPGKAVQQKAVLAIGLGQAFGHYAHHNVVGNQLTGLHVFSACCPREFWQPWLL